MIMELGDLINEISELVYIADVETYELLFLNTAGRKLFGKEKLAGIKCYALFHGLQAPCSFCNNPSLDETAFQQWECTYAAVQRHCILRDKLIRWNGRLGHLVIALDVTTQHWQKIQLQHRLMLEEVNLDCMMYLHQVTDLKEALLYLLERIGSFLAADCAYVMAARDGTIWEWPAGGEALNCGNRSRGDFLKSALEKLCAQEHIVCTRTEDLPADVFADLRSLGVEEIAAQRLMQCGRTIGYLGIHNPRQRCAFIRPLLDTLSFFITSTFERLYAEEEKRLSSDLDELTGLYNRRRYLRDIDRYRSADRQPIGVACVDVNGLKDLNQRYGQDYGDQLLTAVADGLFSVFGKEGVYRVGNDEFAVICPGVEERAFDGYIAELRSVIMARLNQRAALGYAWAPTPEKLPLLISQADQRMYEDKREYYRTHPIASKRYRPSEDEIVELIHEDPLCRAIQNGRFQVYLQSKHRFADRELSGAEALIRYESADGAIVSPQYFIPALEEAKLIRYVDLFVFSAMCAKMREWMDEGRPVVPVSLNFSRYTLLERGLVSYLKTKRQECGIPEQLLQIEITESLGSIDHQYVSSIIDQMKIAGFTVSIDDFGIKYANLLMFTEAAIDELKLDRSFLDKLAENEKTQALIQAMARICRQVGVHLIVEGVETEEQFAILRRLECYAAQGYLFSRPVPIREYETRFMTASAENARVE